ncbi:MAG: DNA polymerase I, partial [Acidimicrobiales bacterium]|nr:DNA polymerase I [Acidimicrobiales bacterium]
MAKPLLLIDGNSLTYRAFFALPTDMATASGQVTNAVFGFTSMLINLLRDHEPSGVVITFDLPKPTFRHKANPEYKATRESAPDILRQQMGLVREVVDAINIPVIELEGYEADDILATLATRARDQKRAVIIVTGDRDSYQLVEDPFIKVLYNKRGVSDYALYDEKGILERTGVKPSDYVSYAALRGDKSDNLPGVPGVGEKTAAKLINTYGGLDGIFDATEDQTPKLRQNLEENEDQARMNLELMELVRDAPVDAELDELQMGEPDHDEIKRLFDFLEFRSLHERLAEVIGGSVDRVERTVLEPEVETFDTPAATAEQLAGITSDVPVAIGYDEDNASAGVAVVKDGEAASVVWVPQSQLTDEAVANALGALGGDHGVALHDAKAIYRSWLTVGVEVPALTLDSAIAAYLLDPAESSYDLREVLLRYTECELPEPGPAASGQLDFGETSVDTSVLAGRNALAVDRLIEPLNRAMEAQGLAELNTDIEVPLISVLARMEAIGIGVDVAELTRLRDHLTSEVNRLRALIHEDAGEEFNTNSTKQLREILFEKLELTPQKKTKTGYSTDAASLEKLRGEHPIIEHLLDYREVEKLRSTYGEGLLSEVGEGDRIRATFNQTVARTGRLSSDAPNLHNIPVRSEMGREFRKAFVPADGYELLVADYNQIELRCIAHLAEDPGLIAAFEAGDDIHNATASRVFDVDSDKVTIEQRSKAKMVSYGLAYGMEAYGLGQRLGIPTDEAATILTAYFEAFPAVRDYMDKTIAEARERGYTETLFGRRRKIPELASGNFRIRQAGERQAMNAGIQGLAADIFKVALVNLDRELRESAAKSRLILQVHDEVILEVVPEEHDQMAELTTRVMADAFELRVPLEVNLAFGPSWAEA